MQKRILRWVLATSRNIDRILFPLPNSPEFKDEKVVEHAYYVKNLIRKCRTEEQIGNAYNLVDNFRVKFGDCGIVRIHYKALLNDLKTRKEALQRIYNITH